MYILYIYLLFTQTVYTFNQNCKLLLPPLQVRVPPEAALLQISVFRKVANTTAQKLNVYFKCSFQSVFCGFVIPFLCLCFPAALWGARCERASRPGMLTGCQGSDATASSRGGPDLIKIATWRKQTETLMSLWLWRGELPGGVTLRRTPRHRHYYTTSQTKPHASNTTKEITKGVFWERERQRERCSQHTYIVINHCTVLQGTATTSFSKNHHLKCFTLKTTHILHIKRQWNAYSYTIILHLIVAVIRQPSLMWK